MIPVELISMGVGSVAGFAFKYMAQRAKERAEQFKMSLERGKFIDSTRDNAANRVSIDAGKWVRRLIVISVLFGVVVAPFVLALVNQPLYVQVEEVTRPFLFNLLGGKTETIFVEINGYLLIPEVRQALTAIIGFYFGSATAK